MNHDDDQVQSEKIVSALFGLLTAKFEDGATLAVDGQPPDSIESSANLTSGIAVILAEADILNRAIETILKLATAGSSRSSAE